MFNLPELIDQLTAKSLHSGPLFQTLFSLCALDNYGNPSAWKSSRNLDTTRILSARLRGWNVKGIVDKNRQPKMAYYGLQELFREYQEQKEKE